MARHINISEQWGDAVEVTAEDYRGQAEAFGIEIGAIEERDDGIYIDGEQVATVAHDEGEIKKTRPTYAGRVEGIVSELIAGLDSFGPMHTAHVGDTHASAYAQSNDGKWKIACRGGGPATLARSLGRNNGEAAAGFPNSPAEVTFIMSLNHDDLARLGMGITDVTRLMSEQKQ